MAQVRKEIKKFEVSVIGRGASVSKVVKDVQKNIKAMHSSSKIAKLNYPFENIEASLQNYLPHLEKKYSAILTINEEEEEGNAVIFTTDPSIT